MNMDPRQSRRHTTSWKTAGLNIDYWHQPVFTILKAMVKTEFPGRIALTSSFGTESAVLLHMVARIDSATPVIILDTGKMFPETLTYRDRLVSKLGLHPRYRLEARTRGTPPSRSPRRSVEKGQ